MRGPAQIATYISVAMTLLGFGMIGIAWNNAAELDYIQGQFPYALSGGLGGVGLVIGGMAIMAIQTQRTLTAERTRDLGRLQDEIDHLLRLVVKPGEGEVIEDETIIDVGARTVVRTINRVPAHAPDPGATPAPHPGASPATADHATGGSSPAEGFAPAPRVTYEQPAPEEQGAPVAVIDREESPAEDEVWAPPADEEERARIHELLSDVSGVGPTKQRALADRFGTVAALRDASVKDLSGVPGISPTLATRIKAALQ
jgi:hypothetical protein